MAERIVVNTGPLIVLARLDVLEVAGRLPYDFVCPDEVRAELDAGEAAGHPRVAPSWLRVLPLRKEIPPLALSALDRGEAAVIQLALEQRTDLVCIDEWKGRRAALAAGLKVTGVLGLLGQAKRQGIIQAVRPLLERALVEGVRYHPELVRRVLEILGE